MKDSIETTLEQTRPHLTRDESVLVWEHIQESLTPHSIRSPFSGWVFLHMKLTAALVLIALVTGGGITTAAAKDARPGDFLFPLDRGLERVTLTLTRDATAREKLTETYADERLSELRSVITESEHNTTPSGDDERHARVGAAVNALMSVMNESSMSDTARERVYQNLFNEVDPLGIDIEVDSSDDRVPDERTMPRGVRVEKDRDGETKIEVRSNTERTRIEKKDGKVHIRYGDDDAEEMTDEMNDSPDNRDPSSSATSYRKNGTAPRTAESAAVITSTKEDVSSPSSEMNSNETEAEQNDTTPQKSNDDTRDTGKQKSDDEHEDD